MLCLAIDLHVGNVTRSVYICMDLLNGVAHIQTPGCEESHPISTLKNEHTVAKEKCVHLHFSVCMFNYVRLKAR